MVSNNPYHYINVYILCIYAGVDGLDLVLESRQHAVSRWGQMYERYNGSTCSFGLYGSYKYVINRVNHVYLFIKSFIMV